ncbi:MAG: hypothetical protein IBJ11_11810 [Phycisphaerales bacterium]|nr:hypothetical protein [Phycisphaerales bacterium]
MARGRRRTRRTTPGMARWAMVLALLAVLVAGTVVVALWRGGQLSLRSGPGGLAEWAARQIVAVTEAAIVPSIDFRSFDLDLGGGRAVLSLKDVTLTAPDKTEVVRAGLMRVTLAEVPSVGKPLAIERIELENAALRLVRVPGAQGIADRFKGLVPFVRPGLTTGQPGAAEEVRLSNVLRIRSIALRNGALIYDPGDGEPPMELAGITLSMDVRPATAGGAPGRYALDLDIRREPVFTLRGPGVVDLDDLVIDLSGVALDARIDGDAGWRTMPPAIQRWLREHDARGHIEASVSGCVPLRDPYGGQGVATARLTGFNFAAGEYRIPVDQADVSAQLGGRRLTLRQAEASLVGGRAALSGFEADLSGASPRVRTGWSATGLDLANLLRAQPRAGDMPKLAGRFTGSGTLSADAGALPASITGSGSLSVREGRLMNLPIFTELFAAMDVVGALRGAGLQDSADAAFSLDGQGVRLASVTFENAVAKARGEGTVFYDRRLDLRLNAGPLEKVQGALGKVGEVFGAITDKLVKYEVTGTLAQPQVRVRPLGL